MGMRGERNVWLSCIVFVAHAQHNATRMTDVDRGERAWEESEQCTHVSLNVTKSEQHRKDSGRDLEPEHWKG